LERGPQAHYQTASPVNDVSGQLEEAFRAVKRILVTGVYDHYRFSPETAPLEGDSLGDAVFALAVDTFRSSNSRGASAVQIASTTRGVTLVTNNHAVSFPDTVVQYADEVWTGHAKARGRRPIAEISVKRNQYNLVQERMTSQPFEILARDASSDLALLGAAYPTDAEVSPVPVLSVRAGDSDRLSWGSFVYVLGYPGGYPMVTRGIVSDPRGQTTSSFLIDGLWNEGISGGPILAVRGDDGSLEWVGIARAAAGKTEPRLVPDPEALQDPERRLVYEGRIYLEDVQQILYGISFAVPLNTIRAFIDRNRDDLRHRGWAPSGF